MTITGLKAYKAARASLVTAINDCINRLDREVREHEASSYDRRNTDDEMNAYRAAAGLAADMSQQLRSELATIDEQLGYRLCPSFDRDCIEAWDHIE